ncbi:MAG: 4Fe-4S dicluster domain-containing protein [Fidelibacterota bacterium]
MTLKRLRQIIAALFLLLFSLAFVETGLLPDRLFGAIAHTQIIPSVMGILTGAGIFFALSFILVLIMTAIFGRVYCSFLCPLGIFQDFLARIFYKKKNSQTYPLQRIIQGTLFFGIIITAVLGSVWIINILDPYSLFGKIFSNIVRPVAYSLNNGVVKLLQNLDIYSLPVLKFGTMPSTILAFSFLFFSILIFSAMFSRRFFCTTLCPAGFFLSLFAGKSVYRIRFNEENCTQCTLCSRVCKTDCIDYENTRVKNNECVACFDCLSACPASALTYSAHKQEKVFNPGKRELLISSGVAAAFLLPFPFRKTAKAKIKSGQPVMPPGAQNRDHFTTSCTSCQLCVTHCPTNVITPSIHQYGLSGLFQPHMDFNKSYCEYDCNICTTICPSDAMRKLPMKTKQLTQLGKVELKTDLCVVYINDTDCGACAEGCPTHAVYTVMENNINYPKTRTDICIGCGACQYMCPVMPKAIVVNGNSNQVLADPPNEDDQQSPQKQVDNSEEEFPF